MKKGKQGGRVGGGGGGGKTWESSANIPLRKYLREKKLIGRRKYKMKYYLLCFHQRSEQQRHFSAVIILSGTFL